MDRCTKWVKGPLGMPSKHVNKEDLVQKLR